MAVSWFQHGLHKEVEKKDSPDRQGEAAHTSVTAPQEVTSISAVGQEESLSSVSGQVTMEPAEQRENLPSTQQHKKPIEKNQLEPRPLFLCAQLQGGIPAYTVSVGTCYLE